MVAILLPTRLSYCIIGTKDKTTGVNSKEKINICEANSPAYAVAAFKSWSLPKIYQNLRHIYSQPSDVFSNCPFLFDMEHLKLEKKEKLIEYHIDTSAEL